MIPFVAAPAPAPVPPVFRGDPAHREALETALRAAFLGTEAFGPWPPGGWEVWLHADEATFASVTRAPRSRAAAWVGRTLHLRPWEQLRRRDLQPILRHELAHARMAVRELRRWQEEATCLWAEAHPRLPNPWPAAPARGLQDRLDRALERGTTREQAWAYAWLRAWLAGRPTPPPSGRPSGPPDPWVRESLTAEVPVRVVWPPERLRGPLVVNGRELPHQVGRTWHFSGSVHFQEGFAVRELDGQTAIRAASVGWRLTWRTSREQWIAAATEGELGAESPAEARRALAAVLGRWLEGHRGQHPGGELCPLTHCAVVRGVATRATRTLIATAPELQVNPRWALFTGSAGGHALSPRAVWGGGPEEPAGVVAVPRDRWAAWERTLSAAQVAALKRDVRPGLRPGQCGMMLGGSGPYAVEGLRLAAGRRFGWTAWPSDACEGTCQPDGSLRLHGWGWGHNAGLCLATATFRAAQGWTAEHILAEAFPLSWRQP